MAKTRTLNNLNPRTLASDVAKARKAGKAASFSDGGGLHLVVTAAGRARFVHYFQWKKRPAERWFPGEFPNTIELKDARQMRDADRVLLREGVNPITAGRAAKEAEKPIPTFAEYVQEHAKFLAPKKEPARSVWLRQMTGTDDTGKKTKGETAGALMAMPIDDIEMADVKAAILHLWEAKPSTCRFLIGRIRSVLEHRYANTRPNDMPRNPADFDLITKAVGSELDEFNTPRKSLPYQRVPALLADLALRSSMSARALELIILTGCRCMEIAKARWCEVDWRARTITIPKERMKTQHDTRGEDHVIPLSRAMVRVLRSVIPPQGYRPADLIFPNQAGNHYWPSEIIDHVKDLTGDEDMTTHGFRKSLTNWGTAIPHRKREEFARDLMDVVIAHEIGNSVSQAYLDDRWLDRRRVVMREWSRFCCPPSYAEGVQKTPPSATVVQLRRAA